MRSEGIDCTRIRDLIAVRRVILRDFVHVFPSFTDDFLLFPSDDAGRFAPSVTTVVVSGSRSIGVDLPAAEGAGRPVGKNFGETNLKKKNVFEINRLDDGGPESTETQDSKDRRTTRQCIIDVILYQLYYIIIIIVYTSGAERGSYSGRPASDERIKIPSTGDVDFSGGEGPTTVILYYQVLRQ